MTLKINNLSMFLGKRQVLKNISAQFNQGEIVSIIGPNGAGKSTLLKCLATIYKTAKGAITINGRDIATIPSRELATLIGFVPQHSTSHFPLTVMETVMLGRKPYIKWGVQPRDLEAVEAVMKTLHIDSMSAQFLDELSGGQRQKVLLARALAQEPTILMLDEPTSALDMKHQLEVLELVKQFAEDQNHLIILVLHDLELASRYSDVLVLLKEGEIHTVGKLEDVLTVENLASVYGVESKIEKDEYGHKITAIQPISEGALSV
ncbi:ABC transporter ATP-binding protein [Sporosarcina sp. FSL W7-1349]|uniref:ABC transporter ATP-binding protein n=1 Tax=Sporosarcina sp. FSL W7-1349 TaxID=2921561 RepID=UPI0030F5DE9B